MGLDELEMEEARELVICMMEDRGQQKTPASAGQCASGRSSYGERGMGTAKRVLY